MGQDVMLKKDHVHVVDGTNNNKDKTKMIIQIKPKNHDKVIELKGVYKIELEEGMIWFWYHNSTREVGKYTWDAQGTDAFWIDEIDDIKVSKL